MSDIVKGVTPANFICEGGEQMLAYNFIEIHLYHGIPSNGFLDITNNTHNHRCIRHNFKITTNKKHF